VSDDTVRCPYCEGVGTVLRDFEDTERVDCPLCEGSGEVDEEVVR
jgi:DnaJ-class molecular chaperone